ncbi:MAG: UDP-2,3-diacylglucosamine diphosphatase [Candidatus Krumholzibacteriia bacterium]
MKVATQPTALFVADSHFHLRPAAAEARRVERFVAFLEAAAGVPHLALLGDIFDFWFDYPHFRLRGYEEILQALDRVRDAGSRIHFVGGNHDIWAAGYLHERYGSEPAGDPITLELDGRRIHLTHGDGLLVRDWAYASFRWLVRRRTGIVLAKAVHPELLFALSTWLSGTSRAADRDEAAQMEAKARRWLRRRRHPPWDLLVMGHLHHPVLLEHDGRQMAILGSWLDRLGYGVLREGLFSLADFPAQGPATL